MNVRRYNRNTKLATKRGKRSWCSACDRAKVASGEWCRNCGAFQKMRRFKNAQSPKEW